MAHIILDGQLAEIAFKGLGGFAAEWLDDMRKSRSGLTAIFRDAVFNRHTGWFTDFVAEQIGAELKPGSPFAVKALAIAEAGERRGYDMSEWQVVLPQLKTIAEESERQGAGPWKVAGIARRILNTPEP